MNIHDIQTPALLADADVLEHNLKTMAAAVPGPRLRPHVKAHKCTALARMQARAGHRSFTCATIREIEGMAAAGLGDDLLLANEVLDARRLAAVKARVTVAVDSDAYYSRRRPGRDKGSSHRHKRRLAAMRVCARRCGPVRGPSA